MSYEAVDDCIFHPNKTRRSFGERGLTLLKGDFTGYSSKFNKKTFFDVDFWKIELMDFRIHFVTPNLSTDPRI